MQARCDVFFRLIDDPNSRELLGLEDRPVVSCDITRNRPSECDTASVTLAASALPFDLRVIADKSMFVSLWLFEHQEPNKCKDGDPGQFFGVVDDVSRPDAFGQVTLSCRDMTAIPLQAMLTETGVKAFDLGSGASIGTVVENLLRQIPGTYRWTVESYNTLDTATKGVASLLIKPKKRTKGSKSSAPAESVLAAVIGTEKVSIWSAIGSVCARVGIVPEVRFHRDGHPFVILVDASDLHNSDVLRPFDRGGRTWRVFVDGDGVTMSEKIDLADTSDRPDFLEVGSALATGGLISARWPETSAADDKKDTGQFQFVEGVTSEKELQKLARAGYESLAHNQYRASLETSESWSAGGGPHDPDVLDMGYGAIVEVMRQGWTHQAIMDATTPQFAARIIAAQQRLGALQLLFQCAEVKHSFSQSGYRCEIGIRQFLGRESLPILEGITPERRARRGDGLVQ